MSPLSPELSLDLARQRRIHLEHVATRHRLRRLARRGPARPA